MSMMLAVVRGNHRVRDFREWAREEFGGPGWRGEVRSIREWEGGGGVRRPAKGIGRIW